MGDIDQMVADYELALVRIAGFTRIVPESWQDEYSGTGRKELTEEAKIAQEVLNKYEGQ